MSDINQVVVVSDLHCGCKLGLCPPGKIKIDDGGPYEQSPLQAKVWSWWEQFWHEWVPMVTRHEPYGVVINGDLVDGVHHNSTTQISHNMTDQRRIAIKVLRPIVDLCKGNFYVIRGTEVHGGKSGQDEETIAESLGAIPDVDGKYARWDMWLRISNRLAHITHHIGYTGSMQYETTALMKEFAEACAEAGRWGYDAPDFVTRSHRHFSDEIRVPTNHGVGIAVVTPGWQLRTPFAWHGSSRGRSPQFGGVLLRVGDQQHFAVDKVWNIERTPEVRI